MFGARNVGGHREYSVFGDVVNTAARLQTAASPGSILLGETTARGASHVFNLMAIEPLQLKGKQQPVPAYKVRGTVMGAAVASSPLGEGTRMPLFGRLNEVRRVPYTVTRTVPVEEVRMVPTRVTRMVQQECVKMVPHTTCKMEAYCVTYKVCRKVPVCVPVCEPQCPTAPIAPAVPGAPIMPPASGEPPIEGVPGEPQTQRPRMPAWMAGMTWLGTP